MKEEEVTEVVSAELQLEAVFCNPLRASHNSSIVDENVEPLFLLQELFCSGANGSKRVKRHSKDLDGAQRVSGQFRGDLPSLVQIPRCDVDSGAGEVQCSSGLDADARRAARDQDDMPWQCPNEALVVNDLFSRWPSISWPLKVFVTLGVRSRWGHDVGR